MDPIDPIFRAIGALCAIVAFRSVGRLLSGAVADKAVAALSGRPEDAQDRERRAYLAGAIALSGAGGVALVLMSFWALPVHFANIAVQAGWLIRERTAFPPRDEADEDARRRTDQAAILFAFAALATAIAWRWGLLGPVDDVLTGAVVAITGLGLAMRLSLGLDWWPRSSGEMYFAEEEPALQERPRRVEIAPAFGRWPLRDADTGTRFSHFTWLDGDIAARIEAWDDLFQEAFPLADDAVGLAAFASPEAEARYHAEAEAVARDLEAVFGPGNVGFARR